MFDGMSCALLCAHCTPQNVSILCQVTYAIPLKFDIYFPALTLKPCIIFAQWSGHLSIYRTCLYWQTVFYLVLYCILYM